jgi:hypothetical protein
MLMDGLDGINNRIDLGSPNAKSKRRTFFPTDPAANQSLRQLPPHPE